MPILFAISLLLIRPFHAPAVRIFGPPAITAGAALSAALNDALGGAIAQLRGLPQVHIAHYDDNVLIAAIIANPGEFELSDVVDTCLRFGVVQNAVCEEPSDFLFWDGVHPTAAGTASSRAPCEPARSQARRISDRRERARGCSLLQLRAR